MMNRLILAVALLCWFWQVSPAEAAAQVDGFLGVAWGMGAEQIEQVMKTHGGSEQTVIDQGNALRYRGTFYGYAGYLNFSLWENKFYGGTVSALSQTRDPARNGEIQTCFTVLAEKLTAIYGEPTAKMTWKGRRTYFWTQLPGPVSQDKIDLIMSEHFAEGGLTEGSVAVRCWNRPLENCLYHRIMGYPFSTPNPWH